eukprot:CCRYP_001374-RA/>CCRYP_001374-RA protein AED:0.44 eAED:0.44 QI:0/0/0/1/0/0/3/0/308
MLKSALLFYKKLLTNLVAKGFAVNPYDPCVMIKMIRGKQMTICWHVDDLKISHRRKAEVKKIEHWLRSKYDHISVSEGDKHTYLGMDLDYSEKGKCRITMPGYTKEVIEAFPEVINGRKLPEEQAAAFHCTTAQLVFLSGRARRDIQTAVAFLTTKVKNPDEDNWGKLKRVLRYLNGTINLRLCLSVEDMGFVRWYVDASYVIHEDCKGHTGAMMTLGEGAVISMSRKQKRTQGAQLRRSSLAYTTPCQASCTPAMGYNVKNNMNYQNNKSSITLKKNGRTSASKCTKHIKIRYFFIKDMIEQEEVEV